MDDAKVETGAIHRPTKRSPCRRGAYRHLTGESLASQVARRVRRAGRGTCTKTVGCLQYARGGHGWRRQLLTVSSRSGWMTDKQDDDGGASDPPAKRLIVIGASVGGVEAVTHLVAHLPRDLPAAVAVVVHHPVEHPSALARILARAGRLPAQDARDGELLRPGRILVAASAHHLVVQDRRTRLLDGARVNRVKPSIDVLFQSAALEYGRELVAVVLTGTYNDGSAGLITVRNLSTRMRQPAAEITDALPLSVKSAAAC